MPERVREHARRWGHRPALFFSHGMDWRWIAWREVVVRMDAAAAELARSLEPGWRVAYPERPRPERLLLDLALQAAGAVAVPVPEDGVEDRAAALGGGVDARIELEGDGSGLPLPEALRALVERPAWRPERDWPRAEPPASPAGGVLVRGEVPGTDRSGTVWSAAELMGRAKSLALRLADGAGPVRPEIVVAGGTAPGGGLSEPAERTFLAWALASGAAVALAAQAGSRVATAAWVRPTVFLGEPAELRDLAEAARSWRGPFFQSTLRRLLGRPPRLPFGRLHTVLRKGDGGSEAGPPAAVAEVWRDTGVRVLSMQESDAAMWRRSYNIEAEEVRND